MPKIIPVILCGGSGTRLWPLSRAETPKQFLKLMDDKTLLQKTAQRTVAVTGGSALDVVIVTLDNMREETIRQLQEVSPHLTRHVLGEPQARNTAAAVAYAIHYVRAIFGEDSLMWLLPADHYVGNEAALGDALQRAVAVAQDGYLVTFGIAPTRPETGYGYILKAGELGKTGACSVSKFVEKPTAEIAAQFVASGDYLWSSGMHLFRTRTAIDHYHRFAPDIFMSIEQSLMESWHAQRVSSRVYGQVRAEPFETAVLEKAEQVAVIPCDPAWSDIGCWESLWEIKPKDGNGNTFHGKVYSHETENSLIMAQDRLVTCVGLKDVIIIETGDSVLVADKKSNGSLKTLVQTLQQGGRRETQAHASRDHGWGWIKTMAMSARHHLQEVTIRPERLRDTQTHADRAGYVIVTAGEGLFVVDGARRHLKERDTLFVPADSTFGVANTGAGELKFYEFFYADMPGAAADLPAAMAAELAGRAVA